MAASPCLLAGRRQRAAQRGRALLVRQVESLTLGCEPLAPLHDPQTLLRLRIERGGRVPGSLLSEHLEGAHNVTAIRCQWLPIRGRGGLRQNLLLLLVTLRGLQDRVSRALCGQSTDLADELAGCGPGRRAASEVDEKRLFKVSSGENAR